MVALFRCYEVAWRHDAQRIDAAPIGARHAELESVDGGRLAPTRQPSQLLHQQPGHGIEALFLGELRAEVLVELVDAGDAAHRVLPVRLA